MQVLCNLYRKGGTKVHFGHGRDRVEYHFKPLDPKASAEDPRIDHVAEVSHKEHLGRFLSIEGYELYGPGVSAGAALGTGDASMAHGAQKAADAGQGIGVQLDKSVHDAIQAADPSVPYVFVREGDTVKAVAVDLGEAPAKTPKPAKAKVAKPDDASKMSKADLAAAVAKKTGKKPHPSTSEKKLREILAS